MKRQSIWKEESRISIISALLESESQDACLGDKFDIEKAFKLVSKNYPFGERKNHPYKMWCQCVNQAKQLLGIYKPRELIEIDWDEPQTYSKHRQTELF